MPSSTLSRRTTLAALAGSGFLAACGSSNDRFTVLDALRLDLNYTLLVEAIGTAGLDSVLSGPGPITLFAPSNAAFAALLGELGTSKDALFADRAAETYLRAWLTDAARDLAP